MKIAVTTIASKGSEFMRKRSVVNCAAPAKMTKLILDTKRSEYPLDPPVNPNINPKTTMLGSSGVTLLSANDNSISSTLLSKVINDTVAYV